MNNLSPASAAAVLNKSESIDSLNASSTLSALAPSKMHQQQQENETKEEKSGENLKQQPQKCCCHLQKDKKQKQSQQQQQPQESNSRRAYQTLPRAMPSEAAQRPRQTYLNHPFYVVPPLPPPPPPLACQYRYLAQSATQPTSQIQQAAKMQTNFYPAPVPRVASFMPVNPAQQFIMMAATAAANQQQMFTRVQSVPQQPNLIQPQLNLQRQQQVTSIDYPIVNSIPTANTASETSYCRQFDFQLPVYRSFQAARADNVVIQQQKQVINQAVQVEFERFPPVTIPTASVATPSINRRLETSPRPPAPTRRRNVATPPPPMPQIVSMSTQQHQQQQLQQPQQFTSQDVIQRVLEASPSTNRIAVNTPILMNNIEQEQILAAYNLQQQILQQQQKQTQIYQTSPQLQLQQQQMHQPRPNQIYDNVQMTFQYALIANQQQSQQQQQQQPQTLIQQPLIQPPVLNQFSQCPPLSYNFQPEQRIIQPTLDDYRNQLILITQQFQQQRLQQPSEQQVLLQHQLEQQQQLNPILTTDFQLIMKEIEAQQQLPEQQQNRKLKDQKKQSKKDENHDDPKTTAAAGNRPNKSLFQKLFSSKQNKESTLNKLEADFPQFIISDYKYR